MCQSKPSQLSLNLFNNLSPQTKLVGIGTQKLVKRDIFDAPVSFRGYFGAKTLAQVWEIDCIEYGYHDFSFQ